MERPIGRGAKGKLPKGLIENGDLGALKKTSGLASYMPTTCAIFDAWPGTKIAVYQTWKERPKNWPLATLLRWTIRRASQACI